MRPLPGKCLSALLCLSQDTQLAEGRLLKKYLKPDLLIIEDMGLKILPQKAARSSWNSRLHTDRGATDQLRVLANKGEALTA